VEEKPSANDGIGGEKIYVDALLDSIRNVDTLNKC